jgi:hypothetical protein
MANLNQPSIVDGIREPYNPEVVVKRWPGTDPPGNGQRKRNEEEEPNGLKDKSLQFWWKKPFKTPILVGNMNDSRGTKKLKKRRRLKKLEKKWSPSNGRRQTAAPKCQPRS